MENLPTQNLVLVNNEVSKIETNVTVKTNYWQQTFGVVLEKDCKENF